MLATFESKEITTQMLSTLLVRLIYTGEFRRLGRCTLDWATAVVGEADRERTWVTFTYHSSGPIYETLRYLAMQIRESFAEVFVIIDI